jgi:three-Cys-motif partner protein
VTLDRIGQWSIDKLDMLAEYALRYSQVMNGQKRGWLSAYYYIDAFAGPGIALHKGDVEVAQYLAGSPVRVLEVEPPFDHLYLIDRKEVRAATLRRIFIERHADTNRYSILVGDANETIRARVRALSRNERALVFLDPYGLQVEWDTVELLAQSHKVDVLINFSLMGVIRNLRRTGGPTAQFRHLLERVMHSTGWVDELYTVQGSLLENPVAVRGNLAPRRGAQHYKSDLERIFATVSEPAIMTNSRGGPIYALVFASQNTRAARRIMDAIVRGRQ